MDAVRPAADRGILGEPDYPRFGRRISTADPRTQRRARRRVEDAPVTARHHPRPHRAHQRIGAEQVHREDALDIRVAIFSERRRARNETEEHTSELQSLMRISYAVFCLKKKKNIKTKLHYNKRITKQQNTN